jgi:sulfide:quinone oxidoreductase
MKKVLILGAGFGGLETATGLSAAMKGGYTITLVDKSDSFFVGFSKIDVLFGRRTEAEVRCHYANLRAEGVRFVQASITAIDTDSRTVMTSAGAFGYDYLVIALGADLDHDATPGYRDSGGYEFYSMAAATRLRPVLQAFGGGSLVLGILGTPYKCPPAPYEVACQMHELFIHQGIRDRVQMKMVIPSPRPVPNPDVSGALEKLLAERGIELLARSSIRSIDAAHRQVITVSARLRTTCSSACRYTCRPRWCAHRRSAVPGTSSRASRTSRPRSPVYTRSVTSPSCPPASTRCPRPARFRRTRRAPSSPTSSSRKVWRTSA